MNNPAEGGKKGRGKMVYLRRGGMLLDEHGNDVTCNSKDYLFKNCTLDDGVTLNDIFVLIEKNKNVFANIVGNRGVGMVIDALTAYLPNLILDDVRNIELHWVIRCDDLSGTSGIEFPLVDGVDHDNKYVGIEALPPSYLLNTPVILGDKLVICEHHIGESSEEKILNNPMYTLIDVVYGIVFELTFFGGGEPVI